MNSLDAGMDGREGVDVHQRTDGTNEGRCEENVEVGCLPLPSLSKQAVSERKRQRRRRRTGQLRGSRGSSLG